MRIAVLSDIHGNLDALEAVLADVERIGVDAVHSLGDIVGYGPNPGACVEIVQARAAVSLLGNHDAAVAGRTSPEEFNEFARWSVEWTAARLPAWQIEYLAALPYLHRADGQLFVHASPVEPERWHYIHGVADLAERFAAFTERVCFVGHSHRPGVYTVGGGRPAALRGAVGTLRPGLQHLVNAGSVGQPRDRDPRASYAVYDADGGRVEIRRVAYPVARTQQRMRAEGIPAFLIDRLAAGA